MLNDFGLPWAQIKRSNNSQMLKCASSIVTNYKKTFSFENSNYIKSILQRNHLMWNKIFLQLSKSLPEI